MRDLIPNMAEPYNEDFFTDYEWRVKVPRDDWADACSQMAEEIDYSNFKDEVKRVQGEERSWIYGSLWSTLLRLESKERKARWAKWDTPKKSSKPKTRTKGKGRSKSRGNADAGSSTTTTGYSQASNYPDGDYWLAEVGDRVEHRRSHRLGWVVGVLPTTVRFDGDDFDLPAPVTVLKKVALLEEVPQSHSERPDTLVDQLKDQGVVTDEEKLEDWLASRPHDPEKTAR